MSATVQLGACQSAVYRAEAEALSGTGRRWRRIEEVRRYVDALVRADWFAERWPDLLDVGVERRGAGARWSLAVAEATGYPGGPCTEGRILVAGPLSQLVVLHELAHLLAHPDDTHGPVFARIHLELVRQEMGFAAFTDYRDALRRVPALTGV